MTHTPDPRAPARAPDELTIEQENFLRYGPCDGCDDAFPDEEAVLEAWQAHRERILAQYHFARRPWGWRAIDHPRLRWKGLEQERAILWRADMLTVEERTTLERQWRKDFDRGLDLKQIPRELVRQWRQQKKSPAEGRGSQSGLANNAT
jgi:hypothetical protein